MIAFKTTRLRKWSKSMTGELLRKIFFSNNSYIVSDLRVHCGLIFLVFLFGLYRILASRTYMELVDVSGNAAYVGNDGYWDPKIWNNAHNKTQAYPEIILKFEVFLFLGLIVLVN